MAQGRAGSGLGKEVSRNSKNLPPPRVSRRPSGLNAILVIGCSRRKARTSRPVITPQIRAVLSRLTETSREPLAEKAGWKAAL